MSVAVLDPGPRRLGEGPLWLPEQERLLWFDILDRRLLLRGPQDAAARALDFDGCVSAAGRVDDRRVVVAHERALLVVDLETGARETLTPLDADDPATRSNDGRADPWGGFWIGTMGKAAEPGRGAIWRWFGGALRVVIAPVTIPNAICFTPDGALLHADTPRRTVWRTPLDPETGWPAGEPRVFVDYGPDGLNPDGAAVDAEGCVWIAQWGAGRVARHAPDGALVATLEVPAPQTTCPAFGGPDLRTLYVTSANEHDGGGPQGGAVFALAPGVAGLPEPRVRL